MASVVITTNAFARAMWPALAEPVKIGNEDHEKYRIRAMFHQDNEYDLPGVGVIESHPYEILDGLSEVCEAEFDFPIQEIEDIEALTDEVGVKFPPNFIDGNNIKKLDENGRPIRGEFDDRFENYWCLNLTTPDQGQEVPGVIDHQEDEIDGKKVYSGCWCRLQLEVSAYYKDRSPIVNIALLAVQYVYDDESIAGGGRPPRPDVTKSFGAVKNGNAKTRDSKRMGKPGERSSGRPSRNNRDDDVEMELVSICDWSIEELRDDGLNDQEMVDEGYAEWREVKKAPSRKPVGRDRPSRRPGSNNRDNDKPNRDRPSRRPARNNHDDDNTPSRRPGKRGERPSRSDSRDTDKPKGKRPPKKSPPPKKNTGPKVVMFEDSEYTYEELRDDHGWSDEEIVNSGYGEFEYTDPDR